jgi:hypothetical protein
MAVRIAPATSFWSWCCLALAASPSYHPSCRHGVGALLHGTTGAADPHPFPLFCIPYAVLFSQSWLVERRARVDLFLGIKLVTAFFGILPLMRYFKFEPREGMYTTLMMSTGLTFGSISALFGLTNHIIDQVPYTILLTAVIGSPVVPTLIAQIWFYPRPEPLDEDA